MITNKTGLPVHGDDFYDRINEQTRIWERLETDNILLLAPRRVGKTSLLHRIRQVAPEHGREPVFLDVQDKVSELGFVEKLFRTVAEIDRTVLRRLTKREVGRFFKRVRRLSLFGAVEVEFDEAAAEHWADLAHALAEEMARTEHRWLVLLDELPVFILALLRSDPSGIRARAFLNWLREVRLSYAADGRIR